MYVYVYTITYVYIYICTKAYMHVHTRPTCEAVGKYTTCPQSQDESYWLTATSKYLCVCGGAQQRQARKSYRTHSWVMPLHSLTMPHAVSEGGWSHACSNRRWTKPQPTIYIYIIYIYVWQESLRIMRLPLWPCFRSIKSTVLQNSIFEILWCRYAAACDLNPNMTTRYCVPYTGLVWHCQALHYDTQHASD